MKQIQEGGIAFRAAMVGGTNEFPLKAGGWSHGSGVGGRTGKGIGMGREMGMGRDKWFEAQPPANGAGKSSVMGSPIVPVVERILAKLQFNL